VVGHLAVLRCIRAYFLGVEAEEIPLQQFEYHHVYELNPGKGCAVFLLMRSFTRLKKIKNRVEAETIMLFVVRPLLQSTWMWHIHCVFLDSLAVVVCLFGNPSSVM
jgi:hypothetical protein